MRMSEVKFTSGEWEVKSTSLHPARIKVKDKKGMEGKIIGDVRNVNDANIIAAAPEMYETLEKIMRHLSHGCGDAMEYLNNSDYCINMILKKARGEHV